MATKPDGKAYLSVAIVIHEDYSGYMVHFVWEREDTQQTQIKQ
jgi:hypothetical protein